MRYFACLGGLLVASAIVMIAASMATHYVESGFGPPPSVTNSLFVIALLAGAVSAAGLWKSK